MMNHSIPKEKEGPSEYLQDSILVLVPGGGAGGNGALFVLLVIEKAIPVPQKGEILSVGK